ncbi:MAG: hypothetical protein ABIZ70_13330 [Gemmatimonadales bacterium]
MMMRISLAIASAALGACGADLPTAPDRQQGWEVVGGARGRTAVSPLEYMFAIGCSLVQGAGDSTVIGIKPILGPARQFSCAGVLPDTIRAAMSRFVTTDSAANGAANMMLGSWDVVERQYCYASAGYWQADGSYYLPPGGTLSDCYWVETYTFIPPNWGNEFSIIPISPGGGSVPTTTFDSSLVDPPQPADVAPEWWSKMNRDEKWRCVTNVSRCGVIAVYASYAYEFAQDSATAHNAFPEDNIYDAYRHAIWSALIAQEFGQSEAQWWGDTHEKYQPASTADAVCMDLHNNSVGRSVAASFAGAYHNLFEVEAAIVSSSSSLWPTTGCR